MKIEIGENLFYSWLRHVKECKIVQTNWKVSSQWNLEHLDDLERLLKVTEDFYQTKYGYKIFKKNASLFQIIQQAECDVVGIGVQESETEVYAVEVAFHEGGLNYGSKEETIMKVVAKMVRAAMSVWGYFNTKNAEIIFASPKISPAIFSELQMCFSDLNDIFIQEGYGFKAKLIANLDFADSVLEPILLVSSSVADTTELFLRSHQMLTMFADVSTQKVKSQTNMVEKTRGNVGGDESIDEGPYKELKVGRLAHVVLRRLLQEGKATEEEVESLQQKDYSKQILGINLALLVKVDSEYDSVRYYSESLFIGGEEYKLCSQWYSNNKTALIRWIEEHS